MFGHPSAGLMYSDEPMVYNSSDEHSPSSLQAMAMALEYPPPPQHLESYLTGMYPSYRILPREIEMGLDDSDDDDGHDNEISDESDANDDEQSDGDESSVGELDE